MTYLDFNTMNVKRTTNREMYVGTCWSMWQILCYNKLCTAQI